MGEVTISDGLQVEKTSEVVIRAMAIEISPEAFYEILMSSEKPGLAQDDEGYSNILVF